jgi:hypothetical protein
MPFLLGNIENVIPAAALSRLVVWCVKFCFDLLTYVTET